MFLLQESGFFSSCCDSSNPNHKIAETADGAMRPSGLFGYSHLLGGYSRRSGRVCSACPLQTFGAFKVPEGMTGRAGPFSDGHFPDRLHGGRVLPRSSRAIPSPSGGVDPWPSSPFSSAWMFGAEPGHRNRHGARTVGHGRAPLGKADHDRFPRRRTFTKRFQQMTNGRAVLMRCIDAVGSRSAFTPLALTP